MQSQTSKFETLSQEKRTRILNASISEFSKNEYESASMNSIVQEAKISKGALFNYFVNKSELYNYIYKIAVRKVKKYFKKVRDESVELPFENRLRLEPIFSWCVCTLISVESLPRIDLNP